MNSCELFIDSPRKGIWNMAFDESLLQRGKPIWRLYQWTEPTVSLGYFQQPELNPLQCSAVRRTTGGGAIVHDNELTYSLVFPAESNPYKIGPDLYGIVHESIIEALKSRGIHAQCALEDPPMREKDKPYLCFQRRSRYDIVMPDETGKMYKVVGSAQRRTQAAVLQHGSILLNRSDIYPQLRGINDLAKPNSPITQGELIRLWTPILAKALDVHFIPVQYEDCADEAAISKIAAEKYGNPEWRKK